MKWITRERPKVDRIACPWLLQRFVDPEAEFLYVPGSEVASRAAATGAIPFDVDGVELTHLGPNCSFDAIIKKYGVNDPAVARMAVIVRGADTNRLDLAPACAGLLAISLGLSKIFPDDHEQLRHGMVVYDALYASLKTDRPEQHGAQRATRPAS